MCENFTLINGIMQTLHMCTPDMLELLLTWCMVEGEEGGCEAVMYREMINMLNWKIEVPDSVITTVSQSHTGER